MLRRTGKRKNNQLPVISKTVNRPAFAKETQAGNRKPKTDNREPTTDN